MTINDVLAPFGMRSGGWAQARRVLMREWLSLRATA
jgi:hypothetical protein